jgi:hypothetical protein
MELVCIFYDKSVCFTAIGILNGFGMLYQEKSGNPGLRHCRYIYSFSKVEIGPYGYGKLLVFVECLLSFLDKNSFM